MVESPKISDIHGLVNEERSEGVAVQIAQGTFDEVDYRDYANYLGAEDMLETLRSFIGLLRPLPESLLESLRRLVSEIYFIAESQNIDRILEELSRQWVEEHPHSFWGCHYKLCHIVFFSLLILNSDLYNDNSVGKFSRSQFIENTLYALNKEAKATGYTLDEVEFLIEEQLGAYYDQLKSAGLPLCTREASRPSSRSNLQLHRRSSRFSMRSATLNTLEITESNNASLGSGSSSKAIQRESNFTSNWKFHHNKPLPRLYYVEAFDHPGSGPLWSIDAMIRLCDGDLTRSKPEDETRRDPKALFKWFARSKPKSLFEDIKLPMAFLDGRTRWIKTRVRVFEGRIYIFRLKSASGPRAEAQQDLDCLRRNSSQYFVYNLFEAVATVVQENVVQSHGLLTKDHCLRGNFTLTLPSGLQTGTTVLEFQTHTVSEAYDFVQCINCWAARITSVPTTQLEIVSNEEYGWSQQLLTSGIEPQNLDKLRLSHWKPLLSMGALYDELNDTTDQPDLETRLSDLKNFTQVLQQEIDNHNRIKSSMIDLWGQSKQFDTALENWNKKYLYLNEISEKSSKYLQALQLAHNTFQQQ